MRRLFWVAVGVGLTVLVITKGKQIMHRVTPAGVSEQITQRGRNLMDAARDFFDEMTEAMREREEELRSELNMAPKN